MQSPLSFLFSKRVDELEGKDLEKLSEVAEGWYIDYKVSCPSIRDLAKHMSAFANQKGGLLFIGIDEDPTTMTASSFPGIPLATVASVLVQLREACATHTSPEVYFETKVINGPVNEIQLPANQAILAIYVPEGFNPPYVHSTGRIYRRMADSSQPRHETDRQVFDMLVQKGQRHAERIANFLHERPLLSEAESNNGPARAYLYLVTDLTLSSQHLGLSFKDFHAEMSRRDQTFIPMDNYFSTSDGFIARQASNNDHRMELLTFRWWHNGNARVSIPINVYNKASLPVRSQGAKDFLKSVPRERLGMDWRLADLTPFIPIMIDSITKYFRLRSSIAARTPIFAKLKFVDVWRVVPYIEMPSFYTAVETYGFPIVQDKHFFAPAVPS